jgi:predicted alpha/beta-hydrolase family hydrolase
MLTVRFEATPEKGSVSALWLRPDGATSALVLGHGSSSRNDHPMLEGLAAALAAQGVATLRYNYPYSEKGGGGLDGEPVRLATVRHAVVCAAELAPDLPLFAGGHSMSGRMTSLAQAAEPLPRVQGIVFVAFPLAGKVVERTAHLQAVDVPLLFCHGTRDALSPLDEIEAVVAQVGQQATLTVVDTADHGFQVLKRSGLAPEAVWALLAERIGEWCASVAVG